MSNHTLSIGIEIETVGQTRETLAWAIQTVVGGTVQHIGTPSCYDPWQVTDANGRAWRLVCDSSLSATREFQAEVVSPVLYESDIEELQQVVRAIRKAGAKVDHTTGIHIHLGAQSFDAAALTRLVKIVNKQERLIEAALAISPGRKNAWCRGIDQGFLGRIEAQRPQTLEALNAAWYGFHNTEPIHYDSTRYRGLNLHNVWFRGTVEFRWFNGSLHAGEIKAFIQFVLALGAKAISAKSASSKRREFNAASAKYDFRVFLLSLGLIGNEYKTARTHLLKHLDGSAAWKNGRPETREAA